MLRRVYPPVKISRRKLPKIVIPGTVSPKIRIYVAWTERVIEEEVAAVISGIEETFEETNYGVLIDLQGTKSFREGNLDWFQQKTVIKPIRNYGFGQVVRGENIVLQTYNQTLDDFSFHFVALIIDQDLSAAEIAFVLGSSDAGFGFVVSKARFQTVVNRELRNKALQRLASHEMGHVFNVPVEHDSGGHCKNPGCRMNWCTGVDQLLLEERKQVDFCITCLSDLRKFRHF